MILITPILLLLLLATVLLPLRCSRITLSPPSNTLLSVLVLLTVGIAAVVQMRLIGEFRISDGIEYAASARSFVEGQGVTIELNGARYPSRFAPWFSALFLSPFSLLSPDLRLSGLGVLLFSLVSIWYTKILGALIGRTAGSVTALLALVINSGFLYFTGNIMTEVPVFCLLTIQTLMWLKGPCTHSCALLTGLLTALTTGIRPTALSTIALHCWKFKGNPSQLFLVLLPSLILMVASLTYNRIIFGDFFRSGYHAWMSIPYDYFPLTFNINNVGTNLKHITKISQILTILTAIVVTILLHAKRAEHFVKVNREFVSSSIFLIVSTIPVVAFYLPYFYGTQRFYWPYEQLATVLIAAYIGSYFQHRHIITAAYITILMGLVQIRQSLKTLEPLQNLLGSSDKIPRETSIVSNINPLVIQARYPKRNIIPWDRRVEYASKCFTPHKTELKIDGSITALSHRSKELLQAGAVDVYPKVWSEMSEREAVKHVLLKLEESDQRATKK